MDDIAGRIDRLMGKPCYLIDIFPCTVPETPDKRYFVIEEYFRKNRTEWNEKFCDLLLKLYCYYDFWVPAGEEPVKNPDPDLLAKWIRRCFKGGLRRSGCINIVLPACDALVLLRGGDLYMALYNPDKRLMDLVSQLAGAEGLFLYKAPGAQK